MAPHNYPCMLFSVTEHQVAALLAAVEHTLASPQEAVLPSDGQRYSLATARSNLEGANAQSLGPCRQRVVGVKSVDALPPAPTPPAADPNRMDVHRSQEAQARRHQDRKARSRPSPVALKHCD